MAPRGTVPGMETTSGSQAADWIIAGGWVVTMDARRRVLRDGAVAVRGDTIVAVGPSAEVLAAWHAPQMIDGARFVLTPGFVNGHVHVTGEPLTRGQVPDDASWQANVFGWLIPTYLAQTPQDEALAASLAAVEMLRNGVTSFVEAGTILDLDAVVEALTAIGIRGRVGQWVQDRAFDPADDQTALTDAAIGKLQAQFERYPPRADTLLTAWGSLVGHNTATDALWQAASTLARDHGAGISAHMSADPADPDWYCAATGQRPIVHLEALGVLGPEVSLTHAIHCDAAEVAALARSGAGVTHCPMTAMKGGYGAAAVGRFPEMQAAGVRIALGTDGNNNGNSGDLMRAGFVMAGLFKDARRDGSLFPAHQVLEALTLNGAAAAGYRGVAGALAVGHKADMVAHDRMRPEWVPLLNVVNQLVWAADGRGVHSVWVGGRRVVEDYRMTTIDEAQLFARIEAAAPELVARVGLGVPQVWVPEN